MLPGPIAGTAPPPVPVVVPEPPPAPVLVVPPGPVVAVRVFFDQADPGQDWQQERLAEIQAHGAMLAELFRVEPPQVLADLQPDQDWSQAWKEHFAPFAILPDLIIAPTWEPYLPQAGEQVLTMDPGMAFGTGHHATTALSLFLLREIVAESPGCRVLDLGCGTGILAMGAALSGAPEVLAVDNDPEAVAAARDNVTLNNLADQVRVTGEDVTTLDGPFDLIVANIIHNALVELAPELTRLAADQGRLVLSGILHGEQAANIEAVYGELGWVLERSEQRREWAALALRRG